MKHITIAGAGLTGSLLTVYLAQKGYAVDVFERQSDMRKTDLSAGLSINLNISNRGIRALKEVGLADQIMQYAIPMHSRMMHDLNGELTEQAYGRHSEEYGNALSRSILNIELLNAAESYESVHIHFNQTVTDYDISSGIMSVKDESEDIDKTIETEIVLATDGAPSAIREALVRQGVVKFSKNLLEHGYKELLIPADFGKHLAKNYLHIWPRSEFVLITLPNEDGSLTCTLFCPLKGTPSFETLRTHAAIDAFFQQHFPDFCPLVPNLAEQFSAHPTGVLGTIRGGPWYYRDKVLLLGDAAHAMVPLFGQGMNCAFEDCAELMRLLTKNNSDWENTFQQFYQQRRPNTDAISDMGIENYLEMRDHVGDPRFLLKKKIGQELMQRYPNKYISRYVLVTFCADKSYQFAQQCSQLEAELLNKLSAGIDNIQQINWGQADNHMQEYFQKVDLIPSALDHVM